MHRYIFCELKDVSEDGTFRGIASVYGVEDLDGDVIDKGAFTKTIAENPSVPILWQHDAREVIGFGEIKESGGKVLISGKLDLDDPAGLKAYQKMKKRLVKGLSIGFSAIKTTWEQVEEKSIRHISELKLWEVSVVTFPALPAAQVTGVKAADELAARVERAEQRIQALEAAKSTPAAAPPPEPVDDHSQAAQIIEQLRSMIR